MAFNILSIPGVERVFSQAGRLITKDRNGLSDNLIEASQIQHHGLKGDLLKNIY